MMPIRQYAAKAFTAQARPTKRPLNLLFYLIAAYSSAGYAALHMINSATQSPIPIIRPLYCSYRFVIYAKNFIRPGK